MSLAPYARARSETTLYGCTDNNAGHGDKMSALDRTVVIWDSGDFEIKFATVDGDHRLLHRVYIGDANASMSSQEELNALMDGVSMADEFPVQDVIDGAYVISAGFIP